LNDIPGVWPDTEVPGLLFCFFQMTFAIITPALISGSVVERMRFSAYVIFIALWLLLSYAPLCHWVWGGGWLDELGVLDFAGGTVVHINAGVAGVVAAPFVGKREASDAALPPHNVPYVILGAALLWFGWFGFNGGSAVAADSDAALAVINTNLAASAAMFSFILLEWVRERRPSAVGASVGAVVGLVIITPAAGFVSPMGAMVMGLLGAPLPFLAILGFQRRRNALDDSLDVFGGHGVGGLVGCILTGVFAKDGGLLYTGSFELLGKQCVGALTGVLWSAFATAVILFPMKALMRIRVTAEDEMKGLDLHLHGEAALARSDVEHQ